MVLQIKPSDFHQFLPNPWLVNGLLTCAGDVLGKERFTAENDEGAIEYAHENPRAFMD
jgi:hypothetical protein